jgi:hypothetical protein
VLTWRLVASAACTPLPCAARTYEGVRNTIICVTPSFRRRRGGAVRHAARMPSLPGHLARLSRELSRGVPACAPDPAMYAYLSAVLTAPAQSGDKKARGREERTSGAPASAVAVATRRGLVLLSFCGLGGATIPT